MLNKYFVGDMWVIYGWGEPIERYKRFLQTVGPALKHFIEALFLYDKVVVPTQDFMSLTVLVDILGEKCIHALLESERISFCRYQGDFAYAGNGGGLIQYEVSSGDKSVINPVYGPLDEAINWACIPLRVKPSKPFLDLVISSTDNIVPNDWTERIIHETYMTVINNKFLSRYYSEGGNTNLKKIKGIQPNAIRGYTGLFNDGYVLNEVDLLLMLAYFNLELKLLELTNCTGYSMGNPVHQINVKINTVQLMLGTVLGLEISKNVPLENFGEVRNVVGIPDVGESVLTKEIGFETVVSAANSENAISFREWFHMNEPSAIDISKGYIEFLREQRLSELTLAEREWNILKLYSSGTFSTSEATERITAISDVSFKHRPYLFLDELHKMLLSDSEMKS